ncbi:class I mannose-6-phosphate isomerase [Amedibacillus sp. YH-ame10]
MSFMYNPIPFDDEQAINVLNIAEKGIRKENFESIVDFILDCIKESRLIVIDGYIGADFHVIQEALVNREFKLIDSESLMKDEASIQEMLKPYLPINKKKDPDCIFGKLYEGDLLDFFDENKVREFLEEIRTSDYPIILIGYGSALEIFRKLAQYVFYIDLTPKDAVLRAQKGCYRNIGERHDSSFSQMIRRYYYVDVEILMRHRKNLVKNSYVDHYILETWKGDWKSLDKDSLNQVFNELARRPFRTKPVYLEGVWGGEYMRKIRHVPMDVAPRIAWVFEFIPLEASIVAKIKELTYDIPFYTFLNVKEEDILGKEIKERFQGNFPIRFNYDDTWHSDGNMSIQVHPNKEFAEENYNESNSQDEAYYVVTTGHDAKTYCGFKTSGEGFIELCAKAQKEKGEIDYQNIVHGIPSYPGLQVMIPNGTIHSSGRNQLVLELGSYTVGAYTYKMYDYNRQDLNGELRPIHLYNAEKVMKLDRDEKWVKTHSNIAPITIKEGDGFIEDVVGRNEYMYYETHRIQMQTHAKYHGENKGMFTVLALVDGEEVLIYDKHNPKHCYHAKYLDVVTLPANIDEYVVEAKGYQPVTLHKTVMKRGEE